MSSMSLVFFLASIMILNIILAIMILVTDYRNKYKPHYWVYLPQDKPYDWEYEKFVDMVNAEYKQAS